MEPADLPKLRCPSCGNMRGMRVGATCKLIMERGEVYDYKNVNILLTDECRCQGCRHTATVAEFRDAAIVNIKASNEAVGDALHRL